MDFKSIKEFSFSKLTLSLLFNNYNKLSADTQLTTKQFETNNNNKTEC